MEYLEKMIPHVDLSFFGLGNGLGGKDLEFRAKERGRARGESEEERKNGVITFGNSHQTQNTWYNTLGPEYPEEYQEYSG